MLPSDKLYFLIWLLGSTLLSSLFRFLPHDKHFRWMKHALSIVYAYIVYSTIFTSKAFFISLIPILSIWIVGQINVKRKNYLIIGSWIFCLLFLSVYHVRRMMLYWLSPVIDETTTQMIITIKLTEFMCTEPDEYPELIEWLGYIYFIPSLLAGPSLSYNEYKQFIQGHSPPSSECITIIYRLITKSVFLMIPALVGIIYFPPQYLLSNSFLESSFIYKFFACYFVMLFARTVYYFVWTISEISYIASGANEYVKFNGRNVDMVMTEMASNTYILTNSWNKRTNVWLKDTVYKPLSDANVPPWLCICTTNIVSAFWHGFYPGYYITFLIGGVCTFIGRYLRKYISKPIDIYLMPHPSFKTVYDICKIAVVMSIVTFGTIPFHLYSIEHSVKVFNALHWYGIIFILIGIGFVIVARVRHSSHKQILTNGNKNE